MTGWLLVLFTKVEKAGGRTGQAFWVSCTQGYLASVVLLCDLGSVFQIQGSHLEQQRVRKTLLEQGSGGSFRNSFREQ